jgi:tetratricopeptide (TPR) repeat protein
MTRPLSKLLLCGILAAMLVAPVAAGQSWIEQPPAEEDANSPSDIERLRIERKRRSSRYPVASRVSRYLSRAAEMVDDGEPRKAQEMLEGLDAERLNPNERALVFRLTAFIAYSAGDSKGAIENFEKVIGEAILSPDDETRIRFNIAQLYAGIQEWQGTINALERWLRYAEEEDPLGYYLMAVAYFQLNETDAAIPWAEKAVDEAPEPNEGWLQLLAALYVGKEDYTNATPVLEELVFRFPKKLYWVQLSLIYGALENYRHALAVQQVAYLQGLLEKDAELRRLARSYLYGNLPYEAASVLAKGLESGAIAADSDAYELLANSWIGAREYEKSLGPLQRAAELDEGGDLYVRLGQVHLQREDWKTAADMLRKAVEKGGLKDPGNAELLLGISYYNADRVDQARAHFRRAHRHDSSRPEAARWMKHIENEQRAEG